MRLVRFDWLFIIGLVFGLIGIFLGFFYMGFFSGS